MKSFIHYILIAAISIIAVSCSDNSHSDEPEISEWDKAEITSGDTLFYACSIQGEGIYSFPMIKTAAIRDVNVGIFGTCTVPLPVPNSECSITITTNVRDHYPEAAGFIDARYYSYGKSINTSSKASDNEWYTIEKTSDKLTIHFKKIAYDTEKSRIAGITCYSESPAPLMRHIADGKIYSLPASFWQNSEHARMYSLNLKFIHIPEESVPQNTIGLYGCTYFKMEDFGQKSSADEPDNVNATRQ